MKDKLLKLAESLWADDPNFQKIRARQREKAFVDRMKLEDWGEGTPESDAEILEDSKNREYLKRCGVEFTRPARAQRKITESRHRTSEDEQILSENEPNWRTAKALTRFQPPTEKLVRKIEVQRKPKPDLQEDNPGGLSDEEILSEGEKNWNFARELGNNRYTQPQSLEEANPGNEDENWNVGFEEDIEEFEPGYEGTLTEETRQAKLEVLDRRISRLTKTSLIGDFTDRLRLSDLVEDLKCQKLVLNGETGWSE